MTAQGKWLSKALENSSRWVLGEYCITDKVTGASFWIANGCLFFNGYGSTPAFLGYFERIYLYYKMKNKLGSYNE